MRTKTKLGGFIIEASDKITKGEFIADTGFIPNFETKNDDMFSPNFGRSCDWNGFRFGVDEDGFLQNYEILEDDK